MRKSAIFITVFAVLGMMLFSLFATVSAGSGTQTVNEDQYGFHIVALTKEQTVSYTIEVVAGQNVDVLLMNDDNYDLYEVQENFEYISEGTDLNTLYSSHEIVLQPGTYYIIVDNTDYPSGGATPSSNSVTYDYDISIKSASVNLCSGAILLIVGSVAIVELSFYKYRKH